MVIVDHIRNTFDLSVLIVIWGDIRRNCLKIACNWYMKNIVHGEGSTLNIWKVVDCAVKQVNVNQRALFKKKQDTSHQQHRH